MKILLCHMLWLYGHLLGSLKKDVSPREAAEAGQQTAARVRDALWAMAKGFDRVILAVEPRADVPSWREELSPEHDERHQPWPDEVWAGYDEVLSTPMPEGWSIIEPKPYPAGLMLMLGAESAISLAGKRGSGRDLIATMARLWRDQDVVEFPPGDVLRIVSGRSSLASQVRDEDRVELVNDVRERDGEWTWPVLREAQVEVWTKVAPSLVTEVAALASLPGIGATTARALVCGGELRRQKLRGYGSALTAVKAAVECVDAKLPGLTEGQVMELRVAGSAGGRRIYAALAVAGVRDDVPVDVAEVLGPRAQKGADEHARGTDAGGPGRGDVDGEVPLRDVVEGARREPGHDHAGAHQGSARRAAVPAQGAAPDVAARPVAVGGAGVSAPAGGSGRVSVLPPSAETVPDPRAPGRHPVLTQETTTMTDDEPSYLEADEPRAPAPLARRPHPAPMATQVPIVRQIAAPAPAAPKSETPAMMSVETDRLWAALLRAQVTFEEVKKTRAMVVRGEVRYHYANLSDVVAAVMPSLKREGFFCSHIARGNRLHVRLVHVESQQWIEGVLPFVAPTVNGPEGVQALGSLLTYLRRYLLSMLLGVVAVDDDDDGVAAQHGVRAA